MPSSDFTSLDELSAGQLPAHNTLESRFALEQSNNERSEQERNALVNAMDFGRSFTDYMASAAWTAGEGWKEKKICAFGNISLSPAASILHYGQEVFEGMKAYRHPDNSVWSFRPKYNAVRFNISAARMNMPALPEEDYIASVVGLVTKDKKWVPSIAGSALYLRPFMFADEPFLGVRSSNSVRYLCIASPVGPYFGNGVSSVDIWVEKHFHRAGPGGTGYVKTAGNYACATLPQEKAKAKGFNQVCFLDAVHNRFVEELGGMNIFVVYRDGTVATPALTGTILEGSVRSSILRLLNRENISAVEKQIDINELIDDIRAGEVVEVFACGTAAVIAPIGRLVSDDFDVSIPGGELTKYLYDTLTGIQTGVVEDTFGWMYKLCD